MRLLEWECENALPFKERMRRCGVHVAIAEREREREREREVSCNIERVNKRWRSVP